MARNETNNLGIRLENTEKSILSLNSNFTLITVVLFIGFATIFMTAGAFLQDWLASKQATFQSLRDEVQEQNALIEEQSIRIENLTRKVEYTNFLLSD